MRGNQNAMQAAIQAMVNSVVRDICKSRPADPDSPDTVSVNIRKLLAVVGSCLPQVEPVHQVYMDSGWSDVRAEDLWMHTVHPDAKVRTLYVIQAPQLDPCACLGPRNGEPHCDCTMKRLQLPRSPAHEAQVNSAAQALQRLFGGAQTNASEAPLTVDEIWTNEGIMAANARCGLRMDDLAALVRATEQVVRQKVAKERQGSPASAVPNWEKLRHSANEWADMAINGVQWLRNVASGASDAQTALENMESNLEHCRQVNDDPEVQEAVRAASEQGQTPKAPQTTPAGSFHSPLDYPQGVPYGARGGHQR